MPRSQFPLYDGHKDEGLYSPEFAQRSHGQHSRARSASPRRSEFPLHAGHDDEEVYPAEVAQRSHDQHSRHRAISLERCQFCSNTTGPAPSLPPTISVTAHNSFSSKVPETDDQLHAPKSSEA